MASPDSTFSFVIPDCEPGDVLKVPAPDGVTLQITVPASVGPGDELHMVKNEEDQWIFSKAVRGGGGASAAPPGNGQWLSPDALAADLAGPGVVTVQLDTTKGPILMQIVPRWSPKGVRRFLQLVDDGYYSEIAIYRAIKGGLVQFGIVQDGDPRTTWYQAIEDDPLVGIPYEEGIVSFAAAGPGTRKATLCLFLADFRDQLGKKQPETPIGKVLPQSMGVLHSLFTGYGDIPQCGGNGPDPGELQARGNEYIKSEFPQCDFITNADRWYEPRWPK